MNKKRITGPRITFRFESKALHKAFVKMAKGSINAEINEACKDRMAGKKA